MTDEPVSDTYHFHPIDTGYAKAISQDELRRAFVAGLVVEMAAHVAIPVDRIGGLCGGIDAFLRGETTRIRAVK